MKQCNKLQTIFSPKFLYKKKMWQKTKKIDSICRIEISSQIKENIQKDTIITHMHKNVILKWVFPHINALQVLNNQNPISADPKRCWCHFISNAEVEYSKIAFWILNRWIRWTSELGGLWWIWTSGKVDLKGGYCELRKRI